MVFKLLLSFLFVTLFPAVNAGVAVDLSLFCFIIFSVLCPIMTCLFIWCCVAEDYTDPSHSTHKLATASAMPQASVLVASASITDKV